MLGYIWTGMIIMSIMCSIFTGRTAEVTAAVTDSAVKAIQIIVTMTGSICLWTGIMKIAQESGAAKGLSSVLSPILRKLMPGLKPGSEAMQAVCANITANILGLGNAATPFGLKAISEMQKSNPLRDRPTPDMVLFVVLNTASLQLIPATVAALRQSAGSISPYSIIPYIWISSSAAVAVGVLLTKTLCKRG